MFGAGFVLGAVRTLWIVPLVGVRNAELMESPLMLAVTILVARRIVRRNAANALGVGLIGLGFLIGAEVAVAGLPWLFGIRVSIAIRDPVSGTVYLILLAAFAVMPFLVSLMQIAEAGTGTPSLLDEFIPRPDIRERHEIIIKAPAGVVYEIACSFDIQSIAMVRAIFWLRAKMLGAKAVARRSQGLVADMLAMGWGRLAEEPGRYFVAGAACQPWNAEVKFSPIPADQFALFSEPDRVKIAWTLEVEDLGPALTRFVTETRAVATDHAAAIKFQSYWRRFGVGTVLIRRILLSALRRRA